MEKTDLHNNSSGLASQPPALSTSLESTQERPVVMYSRRKHLNPKIYEYSMFGLEMSSMSDDEREKRVKLIDQLIQAGENKQDDEKRQPSAGQRTSHAKKHKINATTYGSNDAISIWNPKKAMKETRTSAAKLELTVESGPTITSLTEENYIVKSHTPKAIRRGRPPKSQNKLAIEPPMQSSVTTIPLAAEEGRATGSGPYNLRKGPTASRYRSNDQFVLPHNAKRGKNNSEPSSAYNWNDEFPASVVRANTKQGRKNVTMDVSRRDTYDSQPRPQPSTNSANPAGNATELVPGGPEYPLAYARSLARFAADLGPVAWKVASKRISSVLPPGTPFGPGWIGKIGASSQPASASSHQHQNSASISASSAIVDSTQSLIPLVDLTSAAAAAVRPPSSRLAEPIRQVSSHREVAIRDEGYNQELTFPPPLHPYQNSPQRSSFGVMFGYNDASAVGSRRRAMPGMQGLPPLPPQISRNIYPNVLPSVNLAATNHANMPEQERVHVDWSSLSATHQTAQGRPWNLGGMSRQTMQQQQQCSNLAAWRSSSSGDMGGSSSQR